MGEINIKNNLDILIRKAKGRFADYDANIAFEAALPVYRLRVTSTILEAADLTVTSRFLLRIISFGVNTIAEASKYFCLSEENLADSAAELVRSYLVTQNLDLTTRTRHLAITAKGISTLKNDKTKYSVARRRLINLRYDPFADTIEKVKPSKKDDGLSQFLSIEEVAKYDTFCIPSPKQAPTLVELNKSLSKIQKAVREGSRMKEADELVDLLSMEEPYIEYRYGVTLLIMNHVTNNTSRIAAYKGIMYLDAESLRLQNMMDAKFDLIPDDAYVIAEEQQITNLPFIKPSERKIIDSIIRLEKESDNVIAIIEDFKEKKSATQDRKERQDLEQKMIALETQYTKATAEIDSLKSRLASSNADSYRIVKTEEHRPLLKRALKEAVVEVVIISPWLSQEVIDDELCGYIQSAFSRGVKISIAWGLGKNKRGAERDRHLEKAKPVISRLKKLLTKQNETLLDIREVETHEKILVCDSRFAAMGSFNWLSYRGEKDRGYRRESSFYFEKPEQVNTIKFRALEPFT